MSVENDGTDFLLDQKAVSRVLDVSTKTLENWRWKNIGPRYCKMNRMVRYRSSDLMDYIDMHAKESFLSNAKSVS